MGYCINENRKMTVGDSDEASDVQYSLAKNIVKELKK